MKSSIISLTACLHQQRASTCFLVPRVGPCSGDQRGSSYLGYAAGLVLVSASVLHPHTAAGCESLLDRPISGPRESYVRMILREHEEAKDDDIYGKLEDADPLWALEQKQAERMAIAQINANEQLEDRAILQELHTLNNGTLLLAGVMDGHGGWQVGKRFIC